MNWKQIYSDHLCTPQEAIKSISNNSHVVYSHGVSIPSLINKTLYENRENYKNVSIYNLICLGTCYHTLPESKGHFYMSTSFMDVNGRNALKANQAEFYPSYFRDIPLMFRYDIWPVDVAVAHLSTPDENGYCSFGLSCDYIKEACDKAKIIIGEINDKMPHVGNTENLIHISKIQHIVEASYDIPEINSALEVKDIEKKIAINCEKLIEDGSTVQFGIGAIPEAITSALTHKKNLGIHSELLTTGLVNLIKLGVANGSEKTIHKNKALFTFMMGQKSDYDFIDNNPIFEAHPVDYINGINTISQQNKMISVNSCIEIDLAGQIASESIGGNMYSGTGGQADFVRGSRLSIGGKSIIAVPSTTADGVHSRISIFLKTGAHVTTHRNDSDYIVTEYGVACLRGKSLRERARELINIAHPKFREELERFYFDKYKD